MSSSRSRAPAPYAGPSLRTGALWLLLALVIQATLMHYAIVRGVEPSVVLVAVVWFAMRADTGRATLFGFFAGLGEDLIAFDAGGAWTFSTTIAAFLASLPARRFFEDSIPLFMLVTGCATLVRALIFWNVENIEGYPPGLGTLHLHEAMLQAVLNAVLAGVMMLAARRWERRGDSRQRR